MFKIRKLEIDSDQEDFPASLGLKQLQETPQNMTFGIQKTMTLDSECTLGDHRRQRQSLINPFKATSELSLSYSPASDGKLKTEKNGNTSNKSSRRSVINFHQSSLFDTTERQATLNKQLDQIQKTVEERKSRECKLIFQKNNILEGIIRSQKIKKLQSNFLKKIARTSTRAPPVQFSVVEEWQQASLLNLTGIELSPFFDNFLNVLSVLQIITLLVIYTISLVFQDLINKNSYIALLQMGSLFFYLIEIVLNLISIKSQAGKKIVIIKQIFKFYLSRSFTIDLISFFILLLDVTTSYTVISVFRLFIIFKLPQCLHKIEKLEVYFIRNIYNQQYWEFAKVFLVNFCIAHIIALFLAAMQNFNDNDNWMVVKGISNSSWSERYIWSYYWAANIMLTVGFGDIVAVNSKEAICLIFIETFSCIVMAYNINCMGEIINNIRSQNLKRSKKFKIFKKLTDQNYVPQELEFKINNYIEQSSNLKKKFNNQEDEEFLQQLPQTLKASYLRQSNKTVLKKLVFFRDLLDRTLYNFAQHLQTKISHPQQIIRNIDDDFNLMILKTGQIGYVCKKNGCSLNEQIVDLIKITRGESPFLTSLDFLSKKRPLYQIKALKFSVIFKLDYNRFIDIFKQSDMDYELFCFIRDKIRNIPDEFEVLPCQFCNKKFNHFKFTCPKLHYAPYEQHIIDKELHKEKVGKNMRKKVKRLKNQMLTPIQYFKMLKDYRSEDANAREISNQLLRSQKSKVNMYIKSQQSSMMSSKLQSLDLDRVVDSKELTSQFFQFLINTKAKQIIQVEFLRRQMRQQYKDQIWNLNLDMLTDYNSYFSENNPNTLRDKFNPEARIAKKMQKIQNYQDLQKQTFCTSIKTADIEKMIKQSSFNRLKNMQ